MTWILWVIVAWIILGALLNPILIGKERKPLTAGQSIFTSVFQLGVAAAIIFIGIF